MIHSCNVATVSKTVSKDIFFKTAASYCYRNKLRPPNPHQEKRRMIKKTFSSFMGYMTLGLAIFKGKLLRNPDFQPRRFVVETDELAQSTQTVRIFMLPISAKAMRHLPKLRKILYGVWRLRPPTNTEMEQVKKAIQAGSITLEEKSRKRRQPRPLRHNDTEIPRIVSRRTACLCLSDKK